MSSFSPFKTSSALLFVFLFLIINVGTKYIESRGDDCSDDDEVAANEEAVGDGPTSDQSAGLGIEFEAGELVFTSETCQNKDKKVTDDLKGKMIHGHQGEHWMLTGDTTVNIAGRLTGEYILNGVEIKIGSGDAARAASDVANDLLNWDPSSKSEPISIDTDNDCQDWKVTYPAKGGSAGSIEFSVQATAPMPLEAIQSILSMAVQGNPPPIIPTTRPERGIELVTKDFFRSKPNGIDPINLKDDVLGFFSLLLSYAKGAKIFEEDDSPKDIISIMPRSDWSTLFKQVSSAVPGDLYNIVKILACYKDDGGIVKIDGDYCGGSIDSPQPNTKMDSQAFGMSSATASDGCSVKDWVTSIANGDSPDRLSKADQVIDSQVGGLGSKLENVVDTTRAVPLFEFRRLGSATAGQMQAKVTEIENEILNQHKSNANPPRFVKKRANSRTVHIKRQGTPTKCTQSTITPPPPPPPPPSPPTPSCHLQNEDPDQGINEQGCICGSSTLPLLTVSNATMDDQSCAYTAMPSSSAGNPISIETEYWTRNCQACTLVGGIADIPTCTSVSACTPTSSVSPTPTFVVFLSNNTVPIGDADNKDNGTDIRQQVFTKLQALCPDNGNQCDSKHDAVMDHIPTVVDGSEQDEKLTFTIQDSQYENSTARDWMLAAAVASWEQATRKSCKQVDYIDAIGATKSGCGSGPVRRDIPPYAKLVEKPTPKPACAACPAPDITQCHYSATICAGPNNINPVMGNSTLNPYGNHMNIQIAQKLDGASAFNEFICDLIIEGLTALAAAVAPELLPAEIGEDVEFETLCADLASQVNPS